MVYALKLSYLGSPYAGWQRQANALAVQEVLERALEDLLGEPARLIGASRTDAGVHARGQVAHLKLDRSFPAPGLVHGTNHRLPPEIRVLAATTMPAEFDARRCAEAKEYRYRLRRAAVLSPLDAPTVLGVESDLDLARMRLAASRLPGRHDFTAFALSGGGHRQPVRKIFAAEWIERGEMLTFRVIGDGFLRGMVRGLVGTLLEIGRGRRGPDWMAALLAGRPRGDAGPTVPPQGLVLQRVFYPPEWDPDFSVVI